MNIVTIFILAMVAGLIVFIKNFKSKKNAIFTYTQTDYLEIIERLKKTEPSLFCSDESVQTANEPDDKNNFGEIPWGHHDLHNGYYQYYKGEIKNGVPHGYGEVYEIDRSGWQNDKLLYSGRWENGEYMDRKSRLDELTEEEWREIN